MFNRQVFDRLRDANGVSTAVLDEWFFADLLAESLESASLLTRLFTDGRILRAAGLLNGPAASPVCRFVPALRISSGLTQTARFVRCESRTGPCARRGMRRPYRSP